MKIRPAAFALPLPGALIASLLVHAGAMLVSPEQPQMQTPRAIPAATPASVATRRRDVIKLRLLAAAPIAAAVRERAHRASSDAPLAHLVAPLKAGSPRALLLPSLQPARTPAQAPAQAPAAPADGAHGGPVPPEAGVAGVALPSVQAVSPSALHAITEPHAQLTAPRFDVSYLDNPAPAYPPLSRRVGEQGRVLLRVQVDAGGLPSHVEIGSSSGSSRLDQAALEAVRRWKFVPATRGDKAVAAQVLVPIQFNLRS